LTACECTNGFEVDLPTQACACAEGKGTFTSDLGELCQDCSLGYFKSSSLSTSCTACAAWASTASVGANSSTECFCLPGMEEALGSCACEAGAFLSTGFNYQYGASPSVRPCSLCEGGTYTSTVGNDFYCEPCKGGTYKSVAGDGSCSACPTNSDEAVEGLTSLSACTLTTYKDETSNSACDACPSGMSAGSTGSTKITDCICPVSQYMKIDGEVRSCIDCPTGAICNGQEGPRSMRVNASYWRYSRDSLVFYTCAPASVCPGTTVADEKGLCREGHDGPRCAACVQGYGMSADGLCTECPSLSGSAREAASRAKFAENAMIVTAALVAILSVVSAISYMKIRQVISIISHTHIPHAHTHMYLSTRKLVHTRACTHACTTRTHI
ncbi:hypothetical protein T492DRAFT_593762, partial [Pavlovales sp. CCMP2436]